MTFGEYAEVYAGGNITNTNEERTTSAIGLYPSGNLQGGWIFMSLNTGRALHRKQWKKLAVTNKIIERVEELAMKENQPYIANNFKYRWASSGTEQLKSQRNNDNYDDSIHTDTDEFFDPPIVEFHEISDEVNEIEMENVVDDNSISHDTEYKDEGASDDNMTDETEQVIIPDHVPSNVVPMEQTEAHNEALSNSDEEKSYDDSISEPDIDDGTNINATVATAMENNTTVEETENLSTATIEVTERGGHNLRNRNTVNYCTLHRYGEKQLM